MKIKVFLSALLLTVSLATPGRSQGMFGSRPKVPFEQFAQFFGKNVAFSATAVIVIKDSTGQSQHEMQAAFAMLNGKVRSEMDMTKMSGNMPAEALAHMKQMGLDRAVTLVIPDQKLLYMIYPGLKAYCEMSSGTTAAGEPIQEPKIEKTKLGKETLDGHVCTKSKITTTRANGQQHETFIWQATDLKDLPIQIEMTTAEGHVVTIHYTNINQSPPDAALFELPSTYTRYAGMQELMRGLMGRQMPARMQAPGAVPPHSGSE